jgi:hypothetical protein
MAGNEKIAAITNANGPTSSRRMRNTLNARLPAPNGIGFAPNFQQ